MVWDPRRFVKQPKPLPGNSPKVRSLVPEMHLNGRGSQLRFLRDRTTGVETLRLRSYVEKF